MSSKNKTQVIIAGKIYTLSGYESEDYLQKVATYLNGKMDEFRSLEGYHRLSPEMKGILLDLNIADDDFKVKKKLEELEEELVQKDREMYDLKHELITSQIQFENAEKEMQLIKDQEAELQKENIRLETQLKSHSKR